MKKYYQLKEMLTEAEKEKSQVDRDIEAVTAQIDSLKQRNKLEKSSARDIEIIKLNDKKKQLAVDKAKEKITEEVFVKSFYDGPAEFSKIKLLALRSKGLVVNVGDDEVFIKFTSDSDYETYKKLASSMNIDVSLDESDDSDEIKKRIKEIQDMLSDISKDEYSSERDYQAALKFWKKNIRDLKNSLNEDANEGLNGYIGFWKSQKFEVYAKTPYEAQQKLVPIIQKTTRKKVKGYEITIKLAELAGGKQVTSWAEGLQTEGYLTYVNGLGDKAFTDSDIGHSRNYTYGSRQIGHIRLKSMSEVGRGLLQATPEDIRFYGKGTCRIETQRTRINPNEASIVKIDPFNNKIYWLRDYDSDIERADFANPVKYIQLIVQNYDGNINSWLKKIGY